MLILTREKNDPKVLSNLIKGRQSQWQSQDLNPDLLAPPLPLLSALRSQTQITPSPRAYNGMKPPTEQLYYINEPPSASF